MFSRKGLGENSRTNVPTWNTHQILDFFFFKREAKIKHSRAYCLLISMCLLSLPKLKLPTNTFPTQCYESVQINMGSSETMTPYGKTSPRSLNRMQNALGFNPSCKVKMAWFTKVGGWLPLQFVNMDGQAFKGI